MYNEKSTFNKIVGVVCGGIISSASIYIAKSEYDKYMFTNHFDKVKEKYYKKKIKKSLTHCTLSELEKINDIAN